jgi:hypothetical protein
MDVISEKKFENDVNQTMTTNELKTPALIEIIDVSGCMNSSNRRT